MAWCGRHGVWRAMSARAGGLRAMLSREQLDYVRMIGGVPAAWWLPANAQIALNTQSVVRSNPFSRMSRDA